MRKIKTIIVGAYSLFSETFLLKSYKEACETFVITGSKSKDGNKHTGVIEEYCFEYDNSNIKYILESTKADTLIFTGALDTKFQWNSKKDAVAYMSGLTNILISASRTGIKRFIYLSTTDIYQTKGLMKVDENSPTNPNQLRTSTIKNGEDLALNYNNGEEEMQVVVLRCSEAYGICNKKINLDSFCTKLSIELLNNETSQLDVNKLHDYIHISDLVDAVYKTVVRDEIPSSIYNICTGNAMTEVETLQEVSKLLHHEQPNVKYSDYSEEDTAEFSNGLAVSELGLNIIHPFEKGFVQFLETLQNNNLQQITKMKGKNPFERLRRQFQFLFGWLYPYLETIVAFVITQGLVVLTRDSSYLSAIDFYLLYIVLIALIYGKGQTITALLLSLLGNIFILRGEIPLQDISVDYNTYLWMLQLLIIGMGVGYIRDRNKQVIEDKDEEIKFFHEELSDIKEINKSNIRIKKVYENRLINYKDSFARIYSIITELMDLEPNKIIFSAVDVISQIMDSKDVAIYSVDEAGVYARLLASSTNSPHAAQKSIKLTSLQEIYSDISKHKIYINRTMDSSKPIMAGGVYHEDKLESVVLIWSLPYENTTLYHVNLFSVVLSLIAQALHRSNVYLEESQISRFLENTRILNNRSFQKVVDIQKNGSKTDLAEYYIVEIVWDNQSLKEINDAMVPLLRQHDYLGLDESNSLYLLLTNTNEDEAENVIHRLLSRGINIRKEVKAFNGN